MVPEVPRIISVDDHIVEPANIWTERLPRKYADQGPRLQRKFGTPTLAAADRVVRLVDGAVA